jgi:hypothetical protein
MTEEIAKTKICPFQDFDYQNKQNCLGGDCMAWVSTSDGIKEVGRHKMPYDIYPYDEGNKHRQLISDGYVEESYKTYVKYEQCDDGYCVRLKQ